MELAHSSFLLFEKGGGGGEGEDILCSNEKNVKMQLGGEDGRVNKRIWLVSVLMEVDP